MVAPNEFWLQLYQRERAFHAEGENAHDRNVTSCPARGSCGIVAIGRRRADHLFARFGRF